MSLDRGSILTLCSDEVEIILSRKVSTQKSGNGLIFNKSPLSLKINHNEASEESVGCEFGSS